MMWLTIWRTFITLFAAIVYAQAQTLTVVDPYVAAAEGRRLAVATIGYLTSLLPLPFVGILEIQSWKW